MATASAPYAAFVQGKPIMVNYDAGDSPVAAGDVIVIGDLPCVAHEDIPAFTGGQTLDALSTYGGIYKVMADGAISPGTDVYWDATAKKVTLTATSNHHFGKLVAGPTGGLEGVGPAADGDMAYVFHCPSLIESGASISAPLTITDNSADAIAVGPNGTANPTLQIDSSTSSAATGIKVKSAAAAAGVAIAVISSGTNENLKLDAKGSGTITIGATSTGLVTIGAAGQPAVLPGGATIAPGASTAAAGSTYADAGALPAGTSSFYPTTGADDTKGVIVNAADKVTGRILFIGNGVANKILNAYGPSGAVINGGSANAAFASASGKGIIMICLSGAGNTWLAF